MWSFAYQCDWLMAMKYAERLANENKWSKATYIYLKGSFLALCSDEPRTKEMVNDLYRCVWLYTLYIPNVCMCLCSYFINNVSEL